MPKDYRQIVTAYIATHPLLPAGKRWLLRSIGLNVPKSSYINHSVYIGGAHGLSIGENVGISFACHLEAWGRIILEEGVRLGSKVTIYTGTHSVINDDRWMRRDLGEPVIFKPVKIGRGSWICGDVTILPGVTIGEGCVVGAGSVVTKNLAAGGIYAGIPAVELSIDRNLKAATPTMSADMNNTITPT